MSTEVANAKTGISKAFIDNADVQKRFSQMLGPKKSAGFLISLLNIVQNNDLLAKADSASIMFAAATAAGMDLPINPNLGHAYIIPYNQKQKNGSYLQVAQFQLGYKGFVQLAMRSGQFKTIAATPIYPEQMVEENPLTGFVFDFKVKVDPKSQPCGYASFFSLTNGFEKTLYMSIEQIKAHGKKFSKTFSQKYGLWNTDFDGMATKTVIKQILSKWAPLSIEMQDAMRFDQGVIQDWEGEKVSYPDNNVVILDADQMSEEKEAKRIIAFIKQTKTLAELSEVIDHVDTPEQREAFDAQTMKLAPQTTGKDV